VSPEERRAANRFRHHQERQERLAARGPKGVAASWWDHARALAARHEKHVREVGGGDPDAAWSDLARALENWCARHSA
jgi:hypothetical protein